MLASRFHACEPGALRLLLFHTCEPGLMVMSLVFINVSHQVFVTDVYTLTYE